MWATLTASPSTWLAVTIGLYVLANHASTTWFRGHPLANPVLLAISVLCTLVWLSEIDATRYLEMTRPLTLLIGPATVSLALPLWRNRQRVKDNLVPLLAALTAGCLTAYFATEALSDAVGFSQQVTVSLAPRSTSAPIAMGLAEIRGGLPTLAMCAVLISGVVGAVLLTAVSRLMRITDPAAIGFTAGLSSHALGVARSMELGATQAAFASLGMLLNGVATSILVAMILGLG